MVDKYLYILCVVLLVCVVACEQGVERPVNRSPMADAGRDLEKVVEQEVTLNGSGSSDPDNDQLSYSWFLKAKPQDSQSLIVDPNNVIASFVPDLPGEYVVELTVGDGEGGSAKDEVTIFVAPLTISDGSCRIAVLYFEGPLSTTSTKFEYNDEGNIASYFSDSDSSKGTYFYNSDQMMDKLIQERGGEVITVRHIYVEGRLSKSIATDEEGSEFIDTFEYNEDGQLIELIRSNWSEKFTYDTSGNIVKEEVFRDNGQTPVTTTILENFDDKPNYSNFIIGQLKVRPFDMSVNNVGRTVVTDHVFDLDGIVTNYFYKYNEKGQVTEIRIEGSSGYNAITRIEYEACR